MLDCSCTNACASNGLPGPMRHWFTGFTHSLTNQCNSRTSPFLRPVSRKVRTSTVTMGNTYAPWSCKYKSNTGAVYGEVNGANEAVRAHALRIRKCQCFSVIVLLTGHAAPLATLFFSSPFLIPCNVVLATRLRGDTRARSKTFRLVVRGLNESKGAQLCRN